MSSELFASRRGRLLRTVLCESGEPVEIRVESDARALRAGQIYKGRILSIEPQMRAAFVDLGVTHPALLRLDDLPRRNCPDGPIAADTVHVGCELLVQLSREPLAGKGARVSCRLALGGRRLVLLPFDSFRGVSRRIGDPAVAARLRALAAGLPGTSGWILRANGRDASLAELNDEARRLSARWTEIRAVADLTSAPALLDQAPDPMETAILDSAVLDRIVTDDPTDAERARACVTRIDPSGASRVECWSDPRPLFSALGLEHAVARARSREVRLRSGGRLIIELTEACVAVDVDSGRSFAGTDAEAVASLTNREAATEIARQLRLRDLGGLVVIDFLELGSREAWDAVLTTLRRALADDPARTAIAPENSFGLVALTRARSRAPLDELLTAPCPACAGIGRVASADDAAVRALDALANQFAVSGARPTRIRASPEVAAELRLRLGRDRAPVIPGTDGLVEIVGDPTLSPGVYRFEPARV